MLIIAIISLVIIFAGPGVVGAIQNQFNAVAGILGSGIAGGTWEPSGSGSGNGTGSATVQAAAKEAKDWTLSEQETVAEDIAKNGTSSVVYAKAKAAMDAKTTWSIELTNGKTLEYRIIGIDHDDLADGSGKAGLTFLTTSMGIKSRMNTADTNAGGWKASELRQKMNSGEIWSLMPSDFHSKVKTVRKLTNNVGGGTANKDAAVSATADKLFLLSYSEIVQSPHSDWTIWSWIDGEGTQYEVFQGSAIDSFGANPTLSIGASWWERSVRPDDSSYFLDVSNNGNPAGGTTATFCVLPAFCF